MSETWHFETEETSDGLMFSVYDDGGRLTEPYISEKHARLIAAAPKMLAALRPFADALKRVDRGGPDNAGYIGAQLTIGDLRDAAAAVAKAEGREPWNRRAAPAPTVSGEPECTDCGGTGLTYQTERRCSCQPAPTRAEVLEEALRDEWVMVPREPTEDMIDAMNDLAIDGPGYVSFYPSMSDCRDLFKAAIAAAPAPTVSGEPVAWRVKITDNGRTMFAYTERLPFEPWADSGVKVRSEPEPLYLRALAGEKP